MLQSSVRDGSSFTAVIVAVAGNDLVALDVPPSADVVAAKAAVLKTPKNFLAAHAEQSRTCRKRNQILRDWVCHTASRG